MSSEHRKSWCVFTSYSGCGFKWLHAHKHTLPLSLSSRSQMRASSQFAGVVTACSLCVCRAVPISQTPSCTPWDRTALASGEFTHLHTMSSLWINCAPLPFSMNMDLTVLLTVTVSHFPPFPVKRFHLSAMYSTWFQECSLIDWQSWSCQTDVVSCFKTHFWNGWNWTGNKCYSLTHFWDF